MSGRGGLVIANPIHREVIPYMLPYTARAFPRKSNRPGSIPTEASTPA